MRHRESPETSVWISNTDMITGVLVIFLFLAVILTHQAEEQKREIEAIAQQSTHAAEELKRNLDEAFTDEEKEKYHLHYNGEIGAVCFEDASSHFVAGSADIPAGFKVELQNFLPKYLNAIAKCNPDNIKEIRIEGHTSSEWGLGGSQADAYFKNMKLSQDRTRAILDETMSMEELKDKKAFLQAKLTANGLSSSHLRYKPDGTEDKEASRRIEFRVVPEEKRYMDQVKKIMKIE